jgi:hypothetical protein
MQSHNHELVALSAIWAIRIRWCSRHSLQTQPRTYAAFVPCFKSSRRVAVRAASKAAGPLLVALGEPPDPVRRKFKVTEHLAEWLAVVDRIQELFPHLDE